MNSLSLFSLSIALIFLLLAVKFIKAYHDRSKLIHIPTVGHSGLLTSYISVFRWIKDAREIVQEGYSSYPGGIFKIPTIDGWQVIVNGISLVDDLRKATTDQLSMDDAVDKFLQPYYTIHPDLETNPYHKQVVRTAVTRGLGARLEDVKDEVEVVFAEKVPLSEDRVEIPVFETALKIAVQSCNRLFVGLPLCRNRDFCDLNINFASNVVSNSAIINFFPEFLHPIVGRIFTGRRRALRRTRKHLELMIRERLTMREQFGEDWLDKPNDLIQWLIDAEQYAPLSQRSSIEDLCARVLFVNLASVQSMASAFTAAIYYLASCPELAEPLRKEIQTVTERNGWTDSALLEMRQLDSFLKETGRLNLTHAMGVARKVRQDFTFSDGTTVPAGTFICLATWGISRDDTIYSSGNEFRPFRFSEIRERLPEEEKHRHQLVTVTNDYVVFGQGRHACPGRFFAAAVLKLLMAHVLLNYDVEFPNGVREVPPLFCFGGAMGPNMTAKVLFKARRGG